MIAFEPFCLFLLKKWKAFNRFRPFLVVAFYTFVVILMAIIRRWKKPFSICVVFILIAAIGDEIKKFNVFNLLDAHCRGERKSRFVDGAEKAIFKTFLISITLRRLFLKRRVEEEAPPDTINHSSTQLAPPLRPSH